MDGYDDDLARRVSDAADELGGSSLARGATGAVARAARRHRRGVVAQTAVATLVLVVGAGAGVRLLSAPAADRSRLADAGPATTSPTTSPTPPDATSPSPAEIAPSPSVSPSPSASQDVAPTSRPASDPSATAAPRPAPCPEPPRGVAPPPGVTVSVSMTDRTPARGETVRITVGVRNDGPEPVSYTTGSRRFDIWVTNGAGTWWLWSAGKAYTMELREATLQPGQQPSETVPWSLTGCNPTASTTDEPGAPLPPGTYTAYGWWQSNAERGEGWRSAPLQFEIH